MLKFSSTHSNDKFGVTAIFFNMVYAFETKTRYQNVVCATWHGPKQDLSIFCLYLCDSNSF